MSLFDWGCQNPVFFDFETTSACDLPARGGRLYATDPTTQILSLVLDIDRTYHVWIPRLDNASELPSEQFLAGYGVDLRNLRIYVGETIPEPIIDAARSGRTFVGHNVMGFDRFIWDRFLKDFPVRAWIDTLYLARSAGLPGGLDKLASVTLNSGKDSAKRLVEPLMFAKIQHGELVYPKLTRGLIGPLLRYNMVDVILLRQLWEGVFADLVVESDILHAHQTINDTGVHIDKDLINWVQEISVVASANAAKKVEKLTNGEISEKNIRSVKQVREWLATKGLRIVTVDKFGMEKHTLRKDIVEQCINNPRLMLDPDSPVAIDVDNLDPTVFEVLRLRQASVRITSAKAERASKRIGDDGRIYDLHAYHQAHTGRFGSLGLQIHNLPKPKAGLSKKALGFDGVEFLLNRFESNYKGHHDNQETYEDLDRICEEWTAKNREKNPYAPPLTVDDFMSALIRPSMVPDRWLDAGGDVFGIADYAAIEARGLAWIADQPELLAAFERNEDVYTWFGNESNLFGRRVSKSDKDLRDICKVAVLGLGYGMGEKKFAIFLSMMGIDLSKYDLTVWGVIDRYRGLFPQIAGQFAGAINGRPYRKGGVWTLLEAAAMNAVAGQGPQTAGKCRFVFVNGTLICELPSGRRLHYRNARIEDRIPAYVYALGLELKEKATLLYDNPHGYESGLYGGKITENCLAADTNVLTYRGILPIVDVQPGDLVWDGEQWVPTAGVVNNGEQETGTWLDVRLTRDHLIFDGRKWNSAISATESVSRDALKWASDSVRSLFKSQELVTTLIPKSNVIADRSAISITVDWYVNRILNVASVDTETPGRNGNGSLISFQTIDFDQRGCTGIQGLLADVTTRVPQRIPITVNVVSGCATNGEMIQPHSSDTQSLYPIGISSQAISIESTTIGGTNPVTSVSYPGRLTLETAGQPYLSNTTESEYRRLNSVSGTYLNGDERFTNITANAVDPLNGCWITTGEREPVYDLLNCGPNHRFTIITNHGPVVVHNCVQAICRDIMACSLVRLLKHNFKIVLHVHDEIVSQFKRVSMVDSLREMVRLMTVVPAWAKGFPVAVEGYCANRYLKSPQSGYPEFAALNGVIL